MSKITKYWIDRDNSIIRTNEHWDQFAMDNDGAGTLSAKVTGKSLLRFIDGDSTKMLIEAMITGSRVSKKVYTRNYRCDSPEKKRLMTMSIVPEGNGIIRIDNEVIHESQFEVVRKILPSVLGKTFLPRCTVCNRIKYEENWHEPDAAILNPLFVDNALRAAHTVCPACRESTLTRLKALQCI